jgi:beta-lactamase class A
VRIVRRISAILLVVVFFVVTSAATQAQPITPRAALERLFVAQSIQADWFNPASLAQLPIAEIQRIINELRAGIGSYQAVEEGGCDGYLVNFERGVIPARISLDSEGRIVSLFFQPTRPQPPVRAKAVLDRLLAADRIDPAWFAPSFLERVSVAQIQQVLNDLRAQIGTYQRVEERGVECRAIFERGSVLVIISLDSQGRIIGIFFAVRKAFATMEEARRAFQELPGRTSLLVLEDGRERVALNPEAVLAVASAFKLTVLDALQTEIAAGRRNWDDRVTLRAEWKSLPSGILQNAPAGSTHSLRSLADLMISISDNTATDVLIHTLGRETIERHAPARNRPFLTTREVFVLNDPRNQDLLRRYREGNEAARRAVLRDAQNRPLPAIGIFKPGPLALDVQWFYTVRELCAVIARVADLPAVTLYPGLARRNEWARIAFKGGGAPDVLNLTTWLRAANGSTYCVAATWNNVQALDWAHFLRFQGSYAGLLDLLERMNR